MFLPKCLTVIFGLLYFMVSSSLTWAQQFRAEHSFEIQPSDPHMRLVDFDASSNGLTFAFVSPRATEIVVTNADGKISWRRALGRRTRFARLLEDGAVAVVFDSTPGEVVRIDKNGPLVELGSLNGPLYEFLSVANELIGVGPGHLFKQTVSRTGFFALPRVELFPSDVTVATVARSGDIAILWPLTGHLCLMSRDGVVRHSSLLVSAELSRIRATLDTAEGLFQSVLSGSNGNLLCVLGRFNYSTGVELLEVTANGQILRKIFMLMPQFKELVSPPVGGKRIGNLTGHLSPTLIKYGAGGDVFVVDQRAKRVARFRIQ